jgi:hypothetical protein
MEEVVLKIKAEGGQDTEAKVKSIKQQLNEAKEAALQAKEGTEEYFQALNKAAGLADKLGDVNKAVNALDPGAKAQAFGNLINTVAGGFQTITGLYGLLGEKSEDVEKLLLKVQSASALAMGIQSLVEAQKQWVNIGQAIKATTIFQQANNLVTAAAAVIQKTFSSAVAATGLSFQGLKAAIASTGIGLLVVGLGAAISKLMDYANSADDAAEKQAKLNKEIADFNAESGKNLNRIAQEGGKLSDNVTILENQLRLMKLQHKPQDEILKKEKEIIDLRLKGAIEYADYTDKFGAQNLKTVDEQIAFGKWVGEQRALSLDKQDQVDQYYIDKGIERAKKKLEELQKNEEDITNLTKDELLKRQEAAKKEAEEYIDLLRVKRDEAWAIEDATTLKLKEELQKRRDAERAADDERSAAEQQAFEEKRKNIEAGFQLAQAAANSLNTLNNIITENEKRGLKEGEVLSLETQKKAFKRAQSLALIQTTINGAQAISSILGQYPKFDGGFAMIAALVSATAAIASQYAVIASQKFSPDGGGGAPPSAPMGLNGNGFNAPSIQPPTNTSGLIQEGTDFKVYVVESDITNTQQGVQQNKKKALITI